MVRIPEEPWRLFKHRQDASVSYEAYEKDEDTYAVRIPGASDSQGEIPAEFFEATYEPKEEGA